METSRLKRPDIPTKDQYLQDQQGKRDAEFQAQHSRWVADGGQGSAPVAPAPLKASDVTESHLLDQNIAIAQSAQYFALLDWVDRTVNSDVLFSVQMKLLSRNDVTLQSLIRLICDYFAPSKEIFEAMLQEQYEESLALVERQ